MGGDGRVVAHQYRTILRFERSGSRERGRYMDIPPAHYSEEEQAQIRAQYELEPKQRRGAEPRFWEDVSEGEPLTTLVKGPLTVTSIAGWLMGWGSPLCQTNRIANEYLKEYPTARLYNQETGIEDTLEGAHWDSYLAQQSGMARGYDFGAQRISWMSHLVTDWMGDDAFLTDLHVQLRRPNLLGDISWLTGKVTVKRKKDSHTLVDLELTSTNQRNEVNTSGTATVRLPTRG